MSPHRRILHHTCPSEPYQLRRFAQHTHQLMALTAQLDPYLPAGGSWQVAAYRQGELCLSTPHHALAAQVRFCQQSLIAHLRQLQGLEALQRLRVIITPLPAPKARPATCTPSDTAQVFLAQAHALLNETKLT